MQEKEYRILFGFIIVLRHIQPVGQTFACCIIGVNGFCKLGKDKHNGIGYGELRCYRIRQRLFIRFGFELAAAVWLTGSTDCGFCVEVETEGVLVVSCCMLTIAAEEKLVLGTEDDDVCSGVDINVFA